jgi:hypothetical protein
MVDSWIIEHSEEELAEVSSVVSQEIHVKEGVLEKIMGDVYLPRFALEVV